MELDRDSLQDAIVVLLLITYGVLVAVHLASIFLCTRRASRPLSDTAPVTPPITLIRPICGLDDVERLTIASTFALRTDNAEIIFCAEDPADPAVHYVEELIAQHPAFDAKLLIGTDLGSPNPKLNNVIKGWRSASHDWVLLADSNLLLPPDYLDRIYQQFDAGTGLVSAPPIGGRPHSFWAEVECAFLNTFQARWQYAADAANYGFAQGKTMLWRKSDLEPYGGIRALSSELAEDAAATKLVRSWGKRVRLAEPCFEQPLAVRSTAQVVSRQSRWAQLRRGAFTSHYSAEILLGALPPLLLLWAAATLMDVDLLPLVALHLTLWYGAEAYLARRMGWHWSLTSVPASVVRDALIPVIWFRGWQRTRYVWRGNLIESTPTNVEPAATPAMAMAAEEPRKT